MEETYQFVRDSIVVHKFLCVISDLMGYTLVKKEETQPEVKSPFDSLTLEQIEARLNEVVVPDSDLIVCQELAEEYLNNHPEVSLHRDMIADKLLEARGWFKMEYNSDYVHPSGLERQELMGRRDRILAERDLKAAMEELLPKVSTTQVQAEPETSSGEQIDEANNEPSDDLFLDSSQRT